MINQSTGQELWLFIETQIEVDDKLFYSGVSWSDYSVNEDGSYTIHSDISGEVKDYIIPRLNALETNRMTRQTNLPYDEWFYRQHIDRTTDYIKKVKEIWGNDMSRDNEPTFRDGPDPFRRNEESNS